MLLSSAPYARPTVPRLPPAVVPSARPSLLPASTPFRSAAGIAKLSADIRKYRGRVFRGPRFTGRGIVGEREKIEWGPVVVVVLVGGIENFVKRGRRPGFRDEGFLERRGGARRRRDVFTEQFGIKSPLERGLKPHIQKSGQWWTQCQSEPDQIEVSFTNKLTIHRNSYVDMSRNYVGGIERQIPGCARKK